MDIAIVEDDLVVGRGSGILGPEIPLELLDRPDAQLRLVAGEIVDASAHLDWFVDGDGRKHILPAPGRQALTCTLADDLERVDGAWRIAGPLARLTRLKARLKAEIDAEAERQRLRWVTPGAGQAMTYARKVEQAKAVLAALDPQPGDYPMLAASIGIDGADLVAVANAVEAMDAAWEAIGAAIETVRLNGKRAIELAADEAAALAVEVSWPAVS